MTTRVGMGFDVHPNSSDPERPLVLAGVVFDGEPGLDGHSDADLVSHACTDAILGASGQGDIGSLFPDTDPSLAGADSLDLLAQAASHVKEAGFRVLNVDCVVVTERPKISPARQQMQKNLTQAVGAPVSVKASRAEGLGAIGRMEGMACWAVALVEGPPEKPTEEQ